MKYYSVFGYKGQTSVLFDNNERYASWFTIHNPYIEENIFIYDMTIISQDSVSGTFTFKVPLNHPNILAFDCGLIVEVREFDEEPKSSDEANTGGNPIWLGRLINLSSDMYGNLNCTCEGPLGFLKDSFISATNAPRMLSGTTLLDYIKNVIYTSINGYQGETTSLTSYARQPGLKILDIVTSITGNPSTIYLDARIDIIEGFETKNGISWFADSEPINIFDFIKKYFDTGLLTISGIQYASQYTWMNMQLIPRSSGITDMSRPKTEGFWLWLGIDDFNKGFSSTNQRIIFGENLLDAELEYDFNNIATSLMVLGAEYEDLSGNTVRYNLNGGIDNANMQTINGLYINADNGAIEKYGVIQKTVVNDKLDSHGNVVLWANMYRNALSNPVVSFKCTAIDLSLIDPNQNKFQLGAYAEVRFPGLDERDNMFYYRCTGIKQNLSDPSKNEYTFSYSRETTLTSNSIFKNKSTTAGASSAAGIGGTGSGESKYELPIASSEILGGIKVGRNLAIENDGTLRMTYVDEGRKSGSTVGYKSTAEGILNTSSEMYAHAEGYETQALRPCAHTEGYKVIANGYYAHAEGDGRKETGDGTTIPGTHPAPGAYGTASHAEGGGTTASGVRSHAEGSLTIASALGAHAEGCATYLDNELKVFQYNEASGKGSHAEGHGTKASGSGSHAEGVAININGELTSVTSSGEGSHAEGGGTTASGNYSHAEGCGTSALGLSSHAEGYYSGETEFKKYGAMGNYSHSEGYNTRAGLSLKYYPNTYLKYNDASHAEGYETLATGIGSHAEGYRTSAMVTGNGAHVEGYETRAEIANLDNGAGSHAEGYKTIVEGTGGHSEGYETLAWGAASHSEGYKTTAWGFCTHAEGFGTEAVSQYTHAALGIEYLDCQHVEGRYNAIMWGPLHIIGNGKSNEERSNAFRVTDTGVFGGGYNSSGADYAELFEWADSNPNSEDRVGRFVTLDGEYISLADSETSTDDILGIISGNPSVAGDVYDDQWSGMYETDIYGRPLYEEVHHEAELNEEGNIIREAYDSMERKINPNYDSTQRYKPRSSRPEWDYVGLMGKLVMLDDGTAEVNGYVKPSDEGIATKSETRTKFRVMRRLDENHIKILVL